MVICINRMLFLHDAEHIETDAYRSIVSEVALLLGNSEVFRHHDVVGEMHSLSRINIPLLSYGGRFCTSRKSKRFAFIVNKIDSLLRNEIKYNRRK